MNYLQNHCWCSSSNWGGMYDCRHTVWLKKYSDEDKEDWSNIITVENRVPTLIPEALQWLKDNVRDTPKPYYKNLTIKGWCIGSVEYAVHGHSGFHLFFQRKSDAMAFIKRWSKWGKPVSYTQYFTDVRKTLDLKTLKYTTVRRG